MKNFASLNLVALLVVTSLSGCGALPIGKDNEKNAPQWTQAKLQAYLARESEAEMSAAGPFYFGSFDGITALSTDYSRQRDAKTTEIISVIDGSIDRLSELDQKLRMQKEIFAEYVGEIVAKEKSANVWAEELLNATDLSALTAALSDLTELRVTADRIADKDASWGFVQFQKYAGLVRLIDLYSIEAGNQMARATALYYLLEADADPAYKEMNVRFVTKMDPISDESSALVHQLYADASALYFGENQLFTADYHFAKAALVEIDAEIATAQKAFDVYQGTNAELTPELLETLRQELADIKAHREAIAAYLDTIPAESLLTAEQLADASNAAASLLVPVVHAQMDLPGYFQKKVTDAVKTAKFVKDMGMAAIRVTGQTIKDTYDKSGAHEAVKDGAQIINGGLEAVSSTVEVGVYGVQEIYWGDFSWKNFKQKIENEKQELYDKFVQGKLGKEQMDEMIHQVDQFKRNTDRFIENMSNFAGDMSGILSGQPKVGKFVRDVSKNVGHEAKSTLDTATDFTKSIAIVLHPESSKQATRDALLDIYTKLKATKDKDGKDVEVELPDLVDITKKETAKELGIEQEDEEEDDDMFGQIKDVIKKGVEEEWKGEETKDAPTSPAVNVITQIKQNPDMTDKQIRDAIIAEILKGLPATDSESAASAEPIDTDTDGIFDDQDNCRREANADQKDTDADGIGDVCDPDCSGDVDSDEICNELDNCPQQPNNDQADIDKDLIGNVCDEDAPMISEIGGTWPGTIKVTEVYVEPEFRERAGEEGCDIEQVEKTRDQIKPITVTITPTSESGGTLILGVEGDDEKSIPFTYIDGQLNASMVEQDATINFNMSFSRNTSTGSMNLDYLGGSMKIKAEMNLEK